MAVHCPNKSSPLRMHPDDTRTQGHSAALMEPVTVPSSEAGDHCHQYVAHTHIPLGLAEPPWKQQLVSRWIAGMHIEVSANGMHLRWAAVTSRVGSSFLPFHNAGHSVRCRLPCHTWHQQTSLQTPPHVSSGTDSSEPSMARGWKCSAFCIMTRNADRFP